MPAATPGRAPTATGCSPTASPNPFEAGVSLFWPHRVDRAALARCADALRGTHDFTAFTPTQTEHVRFERDILRADWHEKPAVLGEGTVLELWIEADAFMRNMVRVLVGTMLEVAGGRRTHRGLPVPAGGSAARARGRHGAGAWAAPGTRPLLIQLRRQGVGSSVLGTFLVTRCGLALAYLREKLRAWRSRPPKGKPAASGA